METEIKLLKIGELEKLSGVPRYTIHQYIRSGLLPEPIRTGKTMAYYSDSHLKRLQTIQEIKGSSRVPLSFLKRVLDESDAVDIKVGGQEEHAKGEEIKEATAEKRKRQIRNAALKIFFEKGFLQTRIKDITTAAGVSTGTFYIYYKDKHDLFMDAIDSLITSTVSSLEAFVPKDEGVLVRAASIVQFYIDNYPFYSGIVNQLRGMMAWEEPSARDKYITLHNQLSNPIIREIRSAIRKEVIRDVDPELLAPLLMGMVEFIAFRMSFDDKYTAGQVIPFMIDVVMNGIGKSPTPREGGQ